MDSIYLGAYEHAVPITVVSWMQRLFSSRLIEARWKHHKLRAWVISSTMGCLVVDQLLLELSKVGVFVQDYTDDVIIICSTDYKEMHFSLMRFALGIMEKWCKNDKLAVNPSKEKAVLFTSKYMVGSLLNLTMCGREITVVKGAKYLGIMLDSRLSWKSHLEMACERATQLCS